jgi:uncharacterized protein YkwD
LTVVTMIVSACGTGQAIRAAMSTRNSPQQSASATAAVEHALLERTNLDRVRFGLKPLDDDPGVLPLARARAASQLGEPSLSHLDAGGEMALARLFQRDGAQYTLAGENLARWDLSDPDLIEHVEAAFMASPSHRENILAPEFSRLAVGVAARSTEIVFAEAYRAVD